jgi:hypothetical protein
VQFPCNHHPTKGRKGEFQNEPIFSKIFWPEVVKLKTEAFEVLVKGVAQSIRGKSR